MTKVQTGDPMMSAIVNFSTWAGLLRLPDVQFWETENIWRLDSSHRGGHRRDIPCLVDASDVRAVNALKTFRRGQ
jgi:hypothetical protein